MPDVNLISSAATLLSGKLDECVTPDDETCEGGVASVMAYARNYTNGEPTLVIQKFDKNSPFTNMHPLQWVVNRLILNEIFGFGVFISNLSLLLQNKVDSQVSKRDISDLQTLEMPFLVSNTEVNPSNSWYEYIRITYFDQKTGLAVLNIVDSNVPLWVDQVAAAKGVLDYIAKVNLLNGCSATKNAYEEYLIQSPIFNPFGPGTGTAAISDENAKGPCWVPVILYQDVESNYGTFLDGIVAHSNPPGLVINLEPSYETFIVPQRYKESPVWVAHCPMDDETYCQHRISLSDDAHPQIENVTFINDELETLPAEFKDNVWNSTIEMLHELALEAQINNPILGYTGFMPVSRTGTYRACKSGECPLGSLFTEAIRWFTDVDVGFTSSGGYRGDGWPEGPVRLTDLYGGLPFPNIECTGVMSGLSLFKLLNYTTSVATFQGEDTSEGGRLMQVAGMKVTYNTRLQESRLIAVDIWDRTKEVYEPLDRLKLYSFATDSYVCGAYDPYPALTGGDFVLDGEVPGSIGENLIQNIVADYLGQLEEPWDTEYQGRLFNKTNAFDVLNLIQDESSCPPNTVWNEETLTCFQCPNFEFVTFSDEILQFEADSDVEVLDTGRIVLVNREPSDVSVFLKSKPRWLDFSSGALNLGIVDEVRLGEAIRLRSGESLVLEFDVDVSALGSGRDRSALGTVSFGVEDGGNYPGCTGLDATFDVDLRVTPADEFNYLGPFFFVGVAFTAVVVFTVAAFVAWVYVNRTSRVVKVMQPLFLSTICFGVLILSSAMIPLGIDDGLVSERGCDIACMSIPWLVSTGFTVAFSALFSKLWRINKLFNATPGFHRVVVRTQDVLAPFCVLFALNLAVLLGWTISDPLQWQRFAIDGQDWNTYGSCSGGTVSKVMVGLLAVINFGALLMTCSQAYFARNISGEFSESTYIGIAIYGWFQIMIVGIPILFLIDNDNPAARYFITVALIFIVSMSMLLIIFVPAFVNYRKQKSNPRTISVTGIQHSSHHMSRQPSDILASGSIRKNVPLGIMDSIAETGESVESGGHLSGSAETVVLESAARNRKRMIEQQIQIQDSSMAENVDKMMLAMEADSSSDDSSDASSDTANMQTDENSS